jgi:hypothetical protein
MSAARSSGRARWRQTTASGGSTGCGVSIADRHPLAAIYLDGILEGAKPVERPVPPPTSVEPLMSGRTAGVPAVEMSAKAPALADRVIE